MKSLKIAFFGSSLVSAYWNGAATYYRGIIEALHRLGHRITFYEPDAFDRRQHRDFDEVPYARSVVFAPRKEDVFDCLSRASAADVIVKCSGVGVFDALLEEAVLQLRSPDKLVIFWDVDAPAALDRVESRPMDPFRRCIPQYDLIFTCGGGPLVIERYTRLGARRCIPIYNALDPAGHYPVEPEERFSGDLAFLGNRMPDREERVREFFFTPAWLLADARFLLGGSGWDADAAAQPNIQYFGHISTRDHNAFNSSPRAVLNISRRSMALCGWSPAPRVFEAVGAGACLFTDRWEGLEDFLTPDTECIAVDSGREVVERLTALTADEARLIGARARRRILREHTYDRRARQVHEILLGEPAAAESMQTAGREP